MLNVSYGNTLPDPAEHALGGLVFGAVPPAASPAFAHVAMPRLDGAALLYETVSSDGAVREGRLQDIHYRFNDRLLFGTIALDEIDAGDTAPLQTATHKAYLQIFNLLHAQGFPYVLRFWNYMADINGVSHGLERYRQFNLGRQQAFAESGQAVAGNVPAACALGAAGGPLTIAFLAGRQPSLAIENPRQVSAYDYPEQYGPRSPLFSRAGVAAAGGEPLLFISGTASIVGHQTLHANDVAAQTLESIANLKAVLAEVERRTGRRCAIDDLDCIVYLRHAEHLAQVREIVARETGARAAYVQADICRADLLVEIEGSAALAG